MVYFWCICDQNGDRVSKNDKGRHICSMRLKVVFSRMQKIWTLSIYNVPIYFWMLFLRIYRQSPKQMLKPQNMQNYFFFKVCIWHLFPSLYFSLVQSKWVHLVLTKRTTWFSNTPVSDMKRQSAYICQVVPQLFDPIFSL